MAMPTLWPSDLTDVRLDAANAICHGISLQRLR
jgi:hypothetical protein